MGHHDIDEDDAGRACDDDEDYADDTPRLIYG